MQFLSTDAAQSDREQLMVQKLKQCCFIFDFTDPMAELRAKEIKRAALNELLDYITNFRGVITEPVYPEVVKLVWGSSFVLIHELVCIHYVCALVCVQLECMVSLHVHRTSMHIFYSMCCLCKLSLNNKLTHLRRSIPNITKVYLQATICVVQLKPTS